MRSVASFSHAHPGRYTPFRVFPLRVDVTRRGKREDGNNRRRGDVGIRVKRRDLSPWAFRTGVSLNLCLSRAV